MFRHISLRASHIDDAIGAETRAAAKGALNRVIFALIVSICSLRWLPMLAVVA